MRTRTKVKKDATPTAAQPVYRLSEMIVEEVSAVDRAANKREFLIVKSAAGVVAEPGEVVETATGELTVSKAPEPGEPAPAPSTPEAPPVPSATNTVEEPNGTVLRLAPETKAELAKRIEEATKQLAKLSAAVTGAEEVQGLAEIPQELVEGVAGIVSALNTGVTKAAVEKGRKQISMARETKIRAAHTALAEILADLDAPPAPPAEVVDAPAPAPAPSADPAPAVKTVDKRDVVLATLVKTLEHATATITKQASRLDALERARPASNAGVVDGAPSKVTKSSDDDAPWPMDMNPAGGIASSADRDFTSR